MYGYEDKCVLGRERCVCANPLVVGTDDRRQKTTIVIVIAPNNEQIICVLKRYSKESESE